MASHLTHEDDQGVVWYSASGVGSCEMALWHSRMGQEPMDPPGNILKAYAQGITNEDPILKMLHDELEWTPLDKESLILSGYEFGDYNEERGVDYSSQVRGVMRIGSKIAISCHLDGVAEYWAAKIGSPHKLGDRAIIEVKAFGDNLWKKFKKEGLGGFAKYQWQVSVQMHSIQLPLLFVVGHKDAEGKVYEIATEWVPAPPIAKGVLASKLLRVEKAVKDQACESLNCPEGYEYPCPYYTLHDPALDTQQAKEVAEGFGGFKASFLQLEVESLCVQYEEAKLKEALAKKRKDELRDSFIRLFDRVNDKDDKGKGRGESSKVARIKKLEGVEYTVTDVVQQRAGGLDEERMVKDGIDVEIYRKPGTESRSIRVSGRKGE
jgi:hypothetical protein